MQHFHCSSIGINGWSVSSSDIPDSSTLSLAAVNDARGALIVASTYLRRSFDVGARAVVVSPAHQHANHVCSVVADHAELRCIHAWSCLLALICFSTSFALLILMFSGEGGLCNVILSFLICFTCFTSFYYCVCLAAPLRCNHAWAGLLAFSQGGNFTTSSGPGSLPSLNVRLFGEGGPCTTALGIQVCLNNSFDFDFLVRLVDDSLASSRGGRGCTCGNGTSTPPPVQQCCTSGLPHQQANLGTVLPFLAPGDGHGTIGALLAPGDGHGTIGALLAPGDGQMVLPISDEHLLAPGDGQMRLVLALSPALGIVPSSLLVVLALSPRPALGIVPSSLLLAPVDGQMVLPISDEHLLGPGYGNGNSLLPSGLLHQRADLGTVLPSGLLNQRAALGTVLPFLAPVDGRPG